MTQFSAEESTLVWPRPEAASPGTSYAALPRDGSHFFVHGGGCCAQLLEAAFHRYESIIWWAAPGELPHLRARVPGLREERYTSCAHRGGGPDRAAQSRFHSLFTKLVVTVSSGAPTPLQYGFDESYTLDLSASSGELRAATEWGSLRGLETFAQLVEWDGADQLICGLPLKLSDAPAFSWRGLLLDSSRHFLDLETVLTPALDAMAALKLNVLHWHMVDAQSFPWATQTEPRLPQAGAYSSNLTYTAAAVRELVARAHARGIRVVPELDIPAHAASWAGGAPQMVVTCPARVAADNDGLEHGVDKVALHPLEPQTYAAVDNMLTELAELFPDEHIHLGGDEVDATCWRSDARIRRWISALPPSDRTSWKVRLQALFTQKVLARLGTLSKKPMLWDEALEMGGLLPEDARLTVDVWRDWLAPEGVPLWKHAAAAGHRVVWSALPWYLDKELPWQDVYQHPKDMPPRGSKAFLGGEASGWGETQDVTNWQQRLLTRLAAVSERLWSGEASEISAARERLAVMRCRMLRRGLLAAPVLPDHCEAKPRPGADRSTKGRNLIDPLGVGASAGTVPMASMLPWVEQLRVEQPTVARQWRVSLLAISLAMNGGLLTLLVLILVAWFRSKRKADGKAKKG